MNISEISRLYDYINHILIPYIENDPCDLSDPILVNTVIKVEKELEKLYSIVR